MNELTYIGLGIGILIAELIIIINQLNKMNQPAAKQETKIIRVQPKATIEEDSVIPMTEEHDDSAMDLFRNRKED